MEEGESAGDEEGRLRPSHGDDVAVDIDEVSVGGRRQLVPDNAVPRIEDKRRRTPEPAPLLIRSSWMKDFLTRIRAFESSLQSINVFSPIDRRGTVGFMICLTSP